jgi:hypothetical protein
MPGKHKASTLGPCGKASEKAGLNHRLIFFYDLFLAVHDENLRTVGVHRTCLWRK